MSKKRFVQKNKKAILKHCIMYFMFFLTDVVISIVCLLSVKHALKIQLNFDDVSHTIHLVSYIVLTFSIVFALLYSIVQRNAITIPVSHIREHLAKMSEGDFETELPMEKTILDISEFNPIIEDLNKATRELRQMNNASVDFINNVSHEFKTPLAVIQNYTKLLMDDSITDEKRTEYLKVISSTTEDMNSLVTNALKLNRLEHQNIFSNKIKFDLSEQIAESIINFENQIEEKNLNLDVQLEEGIIVSTEKELTSHIWINLISNAIKFTDDSGTIIISSNIIDDKAVVCISDTGCGISKDDLPLVFDKYFRCKSSSSVKGNGLGLPLVKRICDALGMEITVNSELGEGTSFVISMDL